LVTGGTSFEGLRRDARFTMEAWAAKGEKMITETKSIRKMDRIFHPPFN
jgi:hypothetical protein